MNFALSYSRLVSDNFSIKKEAKAVVTKKWAKSYSDKLSRYAGLLYTNGTDKRVVIKMALTSGYGVNIGEQIYDLLTEQGFEKMVTNIKAIY